MSMKITSKAMLEECRKKYSEALGMQKKQILICGGSGCSVCKGSGWVELLPCGLIHPNVLKSGGIDPNEWSGFAFGLGLNRLIMMRYGITDIRHFQSGDIRFLTQF